MVYVKNREIGKGKPLVCVSVMKPDKEGIIKEVKNLAEQSVEMIEWRMDAFEDVESPNAIREILSSLKPIIKDTILVYTFRSKKQGGLRMLDPEQILDIYQIAAETGVPDFVDVEFFEVQKPEKIIQNLHKNGMHVIASHHDFEQTPDRTVMRMLLNQMKESGADIVKLAVMPQSMQDVLDLLEETNVFHESAPEQAVITMSMGALGSISRIAGEYFGSCVTFGAGEKASAPGQLPNRQLENILQSLHQSISF